MKGLEKYWKCRCGEINTGKVCRECGEVNPRVEEFGKQVKKLGSSIFMWILAICYTVVTYYSMLEWVYEKEWLQFVISLVICGGFWIIVILSMNKKPFNPLGVKIINFTFYLQIALIYMVIIALFLMVIFISTGNQSGKLHEMIIKELDVVVYSGFTLSQVIAYVGIIFLVVVIAITILFTLLWYAYIRIFRDIKRRSNGESKKPRKFLFGAILLFLGASAEINSFLFELGDNEIFMSLATIIVCICGGIIIIKYGDITKSVESKDYSSIVQEEMKDIQQ